MRSDLVARALAYPFAVPRESFALVDGRPRPLEAADRVADGSVSVLAFGANASPAALAAKLGTLAAGARVPVVAGTLHHFDVVHSAHVSPYGAIPAALQHSPGTVASVHVVRLQAAELARVHRSEPNYVFARLEALDLRLEAGERLNSVHAYVTRHGCLRLEDGHVGVAAIPVDGRLWPALDQPAMLATARDALAPEDTLHAFVRAQAGDRRVAAERTAALRRGAAPFAWPEWEEIAA